MTVFYNSGPGQGTGLLEAHLANIARGRDVIAAAGTTVAATSGPAAMVGIYEGRPGRGFSITLENGTLFVTPTDASTQRLTLRSGSTYIVGTLKTVTITFTRDQSGRVTALVLREGERERTFHKVR